MIAVKGQSFGVRFYRRPAPKGAARRVYNPALSEQDMGFINLSEDVMGMSVIQDFMPQDVALYDFDLSEMALEPLTLLEEDDVFVRAAPVSIVTTMFVCASAFVLGASVAGVIEPLREDFNPKAQQRRPFYVMRFRPFDSIRPENLRKKNIAAAPQAEPFADLVELAKSAEQTIQSLKELATFAESEQESGVYEIQLWIAAKEGDCSAIRRLVMNGANLDAQDDNGRNALNIALQYGQPQAAKTLMAAMEMRRMSTLEELPDTDFFRKFKSLNKAL